jgi:hypothetical protein
MGNLNPNSGFEYEPLDNSRRQIRLLRMTSCLGEHPIHCSIEKGELLSWPDHPTYNAVSYTWGDPNIDRDQHILIDGKKFLIRENLYHFLRTLDKDENLFWIDQISINQSDVHEQNHQVQFMSEIYSFASEVIVWLGPAADNSPQAMNILEHNYGVARKIRNGWKPALDALFQRPYWKRLWVVQEIMLAQSISLRCGEENIKWSCLEVFFETPRALGTKPGAVHFSYDDEENFDIVVANEAEEIVRARDSGERGNAGKLSYVLTAFSEWHCRNPRDKVYGLLGLVNESLRVEIDYQKSVEDILIDVVRKVIEDEPFMDLDSQIEFAESLRTSLILLDFEIHQLVQLEFERKLRSKGDVSKLNKKTVDVHSESDPYESSDSDQYESSDSEMETWS